MANPNPLTANQQKDALAKISRVGQKLVLDLIAHNRLLSDRRVTVEAFSKEKQTATVKFEGGDLPVLDLPVTNDPFISVVRVAFDEGDTRALADRLIASPQMTLEYTTPATWLPSLKNTTDTNLLKQFVGQFLGVRLFAVDYYGEGQHFERRFLVTLLLSQIDEMQATLIREQQPSAGYLRTVELTVTRLLVLHLLEKEKGVAKGSAKGGGAVEVEQRVLRDGWSLKRAVTAVRDGEPSAAVGA